MRLLETDRNKDDVISMIVHELRTPLMAMSGYLNLLQKYQGDPADERARHFIARAVQAARELTQLIEALLQVLRLEQGRQQVSLALVSLTQVVWAAVAELREVYPLVISAAPQAALPAEPEASQPPQVPRHRLEVSILPEVKALADEQLLKQVFKNLIGNAIRYSPEGGLIAVRLEKPGAPGEELTVQVDDHGIGIAPEALPLLFGRFVRVHDQQRYPIRGSGLGLYITRQLLHLIAGRIWVESQPGKGSTFNFTLRKA